MSGPTFPNGPSARGVNAGGYIGAVNVLDMGCNGLGAGDDGAQLNKIIASVPTIGAHLIIPPGTFNLGSSVVVPTGVTLTILNGATFAGAGTLTASGSGCIVDHRGGLTITSGASNPVVLGRGSGVEPITSQTVTSFAGTNQTLTAAQLLGGIVEGAPTGAATYTTDTGTNLSTAVPNAQIGDSFDVLIDNESAGANAITVAAGAGITLKGSATTIGQHKSAWIVFTNSGTNTWKAYITVSA